MQAIYIEPSDYSPRIDFNPSGKLLLEGRSLPEDVNKLFEPLMQFAKSITIHNLQFDINLEYFNTATSKKLLELLQTFDLNTNIGYMVVNWHYEEDDDDSKEIAEIYAECLLRVQMNYVVHSSLVELYNTKVRKKDFR